ncbi:hypothetical protein PCS76_20430, partial [Acinetobacter baumannii]|nr:hypothetical protein [Acinetobacter baumannii]
MRDARELAAPEAVGRYAAQRALSRLGSRKIPTTECPVLFESPLAAGLLGYPYPVKAWINHMSNPVYAICGFENTLVSALKDPKKLPLFVSVDPFINETSALADYIVPDTVTYESWGIGAPWADV